MRDYLEREGGRYKREGIGRRTAPSNEIRTSFAHKSSPDDQLNDNDDFPSKLMLQEI